MYNEQDFAAVNARIRRAWLGLIPVLAALLAAYVYALAARVEWLAMVAGPLLFVAGCYGALAKLWPNLRYRAFLRDMANGLSRQVRGTILEIGDAPEMQDGALVLPVRLRVDENGPAAGESAQAHRLAMQSGEDTRDERIVYLNASKRALLPGPGAAVALRCTGRHIREAVAL